VIVIPTGACRSARNGMRSGGTCCFFPRPRSGPSKVERECTYASSTSPTDSPSCPRCLGSPPATCPRHLQLR
jgi:hypothetical protein